MHTNIQNTKRKYRIRGISYAWLQEKDANMCVGNNNIAIYGPIFFCHAWSIRWDHPRSRKGLVYFFILISLLNRFLIFSFMPFVWYFSPFVFYPFNQCEGKRGIETETAERKKKMHLFFALSSSILAINTVAYAAAAAAAANLQSAKHVRSSLQPNDRLAIERRQKIECSRVDLGPNFCERSCGPLFTACAVDTSCYAPSLGQTCCQNGGKNKSPPFVSRFFFWFETFVPRPKHSKFFRTDFLKIWYIKEYCPAGTYCSTLGCCINGTSLEQCAADLSPGGTTFAPSVPGTLFATTRTTRVTTTPLVATSSRIITSSPIASSNSAVPRLSSPSLSSPTSAAATPSVSTSPTGQTSQSILDILSTAQTTTATLPRTTSSAIPTPNSGFKNSENIIGLVSGVLGFLLILW